MNYRYYLSLFVVIVLSLLFSEESMSQTVPAKGADATLDIATWNIEWFGSSSSGPSNDDLQFSNVAAVISQADIDLWAVQEIADGGTFDDLIAALGDDYAGVLATESSQQRIGFIYKPDVIQVRRVQHILSNFDFDFATRPPLQLEASVMLPDTTVQITFITVHMKAFSDTQSYNRRVAASGHLKNQLDFLMADDAVVVMGDYNDELGRSTSGGRTSPYQNFLDDPGDYFFATLDLDRRNVATFCSNNSCSFGSTLDHIMITNELIDPYLSNSGDRFEELLTSISAFPATTSDHLPVLASFRFSTGVSTQEAHVSGPLVVQAAYPNPFRDRTTITYHLPRPGGVAVEAFDLLGRKVQTLASGYRAAGEHRAVFNAEKLPPGLYLLRVTADAYSHTQRIVHLR